MSREELDEIARIAYLKAQDRRDHRELDEFIKSKTVHSRKAGRLQFKKAIKQYSQFNVGKKL